MVQSAFLIGAYLDRGEEVLAGSLLDELAELVETLGIEVTEKVLVYVRDSNKRYLTGKGKAHELMEADRRLLLPAEEHLRLSVDGLNEFELGKTRFEHRFDPWCLIADD